MMEEYRIKTSRQEYNKENNTGSSYFTTINDFDSSAAAQAVPRGKTSGAQTDRHGGHYQGSNRYLRQLGNNSSL